MSDETNRQPERRQAEERHGWRIHWIWSIPLAAAGLVIWLAVRSWSQGGPEVTVVFPQVAPLKAGSTEVEFQGLRVGQIEDVHLEPDLTHMRATLSLDTDMRGHLGRGTQFWIIGANFSLASPASLKSLITGVSIGIMPAPGHKLARYEAESQPPVLAFGARGTLFTLHAKTQGSVTRGTPIYFLDQKVGEVARIKLTHPATAARGFEISAFVDAPYDKLVHRDSRFWNAGAVHVGASGGGPILQFQSLPALFEGAIAFETPPFKTPNQNAPQAPAGAPFTLYDGEAAARAASDPEGVAYQLVFADASGVPGPGAAVTLLGKPVGAVRQGALQYDPADGHLRVTATIALRPADITLAGGASWTHPRAQMDDMLRHLIAQGLRASLAASPPVIGGQQVALRIAPGPAGSLGAGSLGEGPVPEIPTENGGGGVAGIMAGANQFVASLNQLPLAEIADNMQAISRNAARFSNAPALSDALDEVARTSANLRHITAELRETLPPTLSALRRTATDAQHSLTAAQGLLSAQGAAASAPGSEGLPQTLYEITRAARALRELVGYLDRHPSALITGRGAGQ